MKKIDNGVFTVAHNLILIDKSYEFLSIFLKGNIGITSATQINKVHVFLRTGNSAYKILTMLDSVAREGKTKIIVHCSSPFIQKVVNTFMINNAKSGVKLIVISNNNPAEFSDDSGTFTVEPYKEMSKTYTYTTVKYKYTKGENKRHEKNIKRNNKR